MYLPLFLYLLCITLCYDGDLHKWQQAVEAQAAEGDSKNSSQNIDMEVSSVRWKTAKNDTAVVEPLKVSSRYYVVNIW